MRTRFICFVGLIILTSCSSNVSSKDSNTSPATDSNNPDTVQSDSAVEPPCFSFESTEEEYAPVQLVGDDVSSPDGLNWLIPTTFTYEIAFSGTPGQLANHEGIDYVHDNAAVSEVAVSAAADGTVVYVRTGCPQSEMFGHNTALRECGSGWGNHIVIDHGGVYTRYGHLAPNSIQVLVGDRVTSTSNIAVMGNTGRSELRHLHFELGTKSVAFDPCAPAQSFDQVYNPEFLF